jgi:Enoyl-(Acyl carrier protein) reductase
VECGGEEEARRNMARQQPIPRAGKPEDIAAMATFLASDEAEWITGTAMVVDGGMNTGNSRINFAPGFSGPSFQQGAGLTSASIASLTDLSFRVTRL